MIIQDYQNELTTLMKLLAIFTALKLLPTTKKSYLLVKRENTRAHYLLNNNNYSHFPWHYIILNILIGNPVFSMIKILKMDLVGNPREFSNRPPKMCYEECLLFACSRMAEWKECKLK